MSREPRAYWLLFAVAAPARLIAGFCRLPMDRLFWPVANFVGLVESFLVVWKAVRGPLMLNGKWTMSKDMEFPIQHPRRLPWQNSSGPPKPGQTIMLCPTERRYMVWEFLPDEFLRCTGCGYEISREA